MFCTGLEEDIHDELATHELLHDFDDLIKLALHIEVCLYHRHKLLLVHYTRKVHPQYLLSFPDPESKHVDNLHFTPLEEQQQLTQWLCLCFGKPGHYTAAT